jgi:hypothetical protein
MEAMVTVRAPSMRRPDRRCISSRPRRRTTEICSGTAPSSRRMARRSSSARSSRTAPRPASAATPMIARRPIAGRSTCSGASPARGRTRRTSRRRTRRPGMISAGGSRCPTTAPPLPSVPCWSRAQPSASTAIRPATPSKARVRSTYSPATARRGASRPTSSRRTRGPATNSDSASRSLPTATRSPSARGRGQHRHRRRRDPGR